MSTADNIVQGFTADRFPIGASVKLAGGHFPWTVLRVTALHVVIGRGITSRTMPHHEALARLRVVA